MSQSRPGYLGKYIFIKPKITSSMIAPLASLIADRGPAYDLFVGLETEFVFSRNLSVTLDVLYVNTTFDQGDGQFRGGYVGGVLRYYPMQFGSIAPQGYYVGYELGMYFGESTLDFIPSGWPETTDEMEFLTQGYLAVRAGKQAFINDFMAFDYGFNMGYVLGKDPVENNARGAATSQLRLASIARVYLSLVFG
jgi:hypothetical protein